jgi:hypothetical protein
LTSKARIQENDGIANKEGGMGMTDVVTEVDARGFVCPMPTIRLGQAIRKVEIRTARAGVDRRSRLEGEHGRVVQEHRP